MAKFVQSVWLAALLATLASLPLAAESPSEEFGKDPAAVARGEAIFKSVCGGYCHKLTPSTSDALFLFDCEWKHGGEDEDIFSTISNGVEGTRMIGFEDALPEGYDDTWRVIAWLRSAAKC